MKNLVIGLSSIYFVMSVCFGNKIEIGKYYDNNYVIFRSNLKSIMYVDNNISDVEKLENNLDVQKVYTNVKSRDIKFINKNIHLDFREDNIFLEIDDYVKEINNIKNENKYYTSIYPNRYFIVF